MGEQVFRKKALDRLSSPEQLNDYLRVTSPSVWGALGAIILLLVGGLIWSATTSIKSQVAGAAQVRGGVMTVTVEESGFAENVRKGQTVLVGSTGSVITGVGKDDGGRVVATAYTDLPDGEYEATITYSSTQIIQLMFN